MRSVEEISRKAWAAYLVRSPRKVAASGSIPSSGSNTTAPPSGSSIQLQQPSSVQSDLFSRHERRKSFGQCQAEVRITGMWANYDGMCSLKSEIHDIYEGPWLADKAALFREKKFKALYLVCHYKYENQTKVHVWYHRIVHKTE